MKNDPLVFQMNIAKDKPHSNRGKKENGCPFCDVSQLQNVYDQEDDIVWLHNKYPTLKDTFQTVIIESSEHYGDLSTYSKEHTRKLIKFSLKCARKLKRNSKYRSVLWYKNFGPRSGGSLVHPHMQIVGLEKEDGYKYIHQNNFEGIKVFHNNDIEVNIALHPVQGYTELNINNLNDQDIELWADWIHVAAKYMLNVMYDGRCDSYNLFFYPRADGGICAKFITRFDAPPYFVGYKLSQVNDEETLRMEAKRFREYFEEQK